MRRTSLSKEFFPGWRPIQVANHYRFPLADWDGDGQTIAIISLGGQLQLDELKRDFKAMRVPWPDVNIYDVSDIYSDKQQSAPTAETHLDLEVIGTICCNSRINIYRGANNGGPGFVDAVRQAVDDNCDVVSISWGHTESDDDVAVEPMESFFRKAADQGTTICVASGDGGSGDARIGYHAIPAADGKAHVQYPASSPWVLACGGTQLMMEGDKHVETVWNNAHMQRAATGGGVSEIFDAPNYQGETLIPSANEHGRFGRVIPDVAALAAGGAWEMVEGDDALVAGGTSAVAPLFASLIALANQKRVTQGKARLGFLNDRLYGIASSLSVFNNIVHGHNRPHPDYPGYDAGDRFDACTGWGSPRADLLFDALVALD